jgi:hypothetical protein
MSDYFAQVEHDLRAAVRRGAHRPWHSRPRPRGVRPLLAIATALLSAASALAATGVIPLGSAVKVPYRLSPGVGSGVPAPGGSRLLGPTFADPEGGPPWGIRVVRTTRGLVCMQIGRVQDGRLGELGIDGAFHDDGRFHPLPAKALPSVEGDLGLGGGELAETTTCLLPGQAFSGDHIGVDRSAGGPPATSRTPRKRLRDVYFGLLGPSAVEVSYRTARGGESSEEVAAGSGAYLIVLPSTVGDPPATGGGAVGSPGGLHPVKPLTAIAYRLRSGLCEDRVSGGSPNPCPQPRSSDQPARSGSPRFARRIPHVALEVSRRRVTAAVVSFRAPLAVENASSAYGLEIPSPRCHGVGGGFVGTSTDRDIRAGALVSQAIAFPFENACGRRSVTITVLYRHVGRPSIPVGRVTVAQPPGTVAGPDHRVRLRARRG